MNICRELAKAYAAQGWSVIPVGSDKRPTVAWKEFQTRIASDTEIDKWWESSPDAQVGVVTGKISNLTVIDVESDGDFNIVLDETFTVQTGGGGRHFYFQYDEAFTNAVRIFPSVDVRSEGGYVVGPGSTTKALYSALNALPVAKMSQATRSRFLEAVRAKHAPSMGADGLHHASMDLSSAMNITTGSRNETLNRMALSLLNKHDQIEAWQMVVAINNTYSPPLEDAEVLSLFNSALKKFTDSPPVSHVTKEWGPQPIAQEPTVVDDDGKAKIMHASEVADLQKIDTDHTYQTNMPPFDDALLGGFSLGDLIVVAGSSGAGKTTLIQDWTVSLTLAGLPSLWFSYEVLAKPLWNKFETMGATIDTPIFLPSFNESGDITWVTEMIEKGMKERGIKVIAIDHLGFLKPPRGTFSNHADALTQTVRVIKQLAVKYGLIVMLPVHTRKTQSKIPDLNDIRDSLGIAQEADTVFFINRLKDSSGSFTTESKVWLMKNRKTGASLSIALGFNNGRYFYDPEVDVQKRKEEELEEKVNREFEEL